MQITLLPREHQPTDSEVAPLLDQLADLLVDAVDSGASVGFLAPLGHDAAVRWWAAALADPDTATWLARAEAAGPVVGVVRLVLAGMPNGTHRAEVSKLLVHRGARGQGIGRGLMRTLEEHAHAIGRTRLVLDTETGSQAESLYESWGWDRVGTIPDYALGPDGRLGATTFLTRATAPERTSP
ncbi:GNAT family N-acetyltransferase [Nocardioides pacificus]